MIQFLITLLIASLVVLASDCPAITLPVSRHKDCDISTYVANHEGCKRCSFVDARGKKKIGVGFYLERDDSKQLIAGVGANYDKIISQTTQFDVPCDCTKVECLNQDQMNKLFSTRMQEAEKQVDDLVGESCCNVQKGMVDMSFQLGEDFSDRKLELMLKDVKDQYFGTASAEIQYCDPLDLCNSTHSTRCADNAQNVGNGCTCQSGNRCPDGQCCGIGETCCKGLFYCARKGVNPPFYGCCPILGPVCCEFDDDCCSILFPVCCKKEKRCCWLGQTCGEGGCTAAGNTSTPMNKKKFRAGY
jgi:GH24 family phage-related lysozyme (muramidase)